MTPIAEAKRTFCPKQSAILVGIALLIILAFGYYFYYIAQIKPKINLFNTSMPPSDLLIVETASNDFENVQLILERYPELANLSEHYTGKGPNPLRIATRSNNHTKILEYFLQKGMDANFYHHRQTPLETAITMDCPDVVKLLVRYGASVNTWPNLPSDYLNREFALDRRLSPRGCSPLFTALFGRGTELSKTNNQSIADILLKHGADINKPCPKGYAPLHYVVKKILGVQLNDEQRLSFTKYLLSKPGIDVNVTTAVEHITPLHFALNNIPLDKKKRSQKLEMIKLLVEHGARTDIKTYKGITAIDIVNKYNNRNLEIPILAILAKAKNPPIVKEKRD